MFSYTLWSLISVTVIWTLSNVSVEKIARCFIRVSVNNMYDIRKIGFDKSISWEKN